MARFNKAKKVVNTAEGTIQFDFANGETRVIKPADLSQDIQNQALFHGVSQKLGDSYASAEDVEEAVAAFDTVYKGLTEGKWTTRVAGEGGGGVTMLVEALYDVTKAEGRTLEQCQDLINNMDDAQVEGLKKLPPIVASLAKIRAERAAVAAAKAAKAAESAGPLDLSSLGA
jgi:hypothetical protein